MTRRSIVVKLALLALTAGAVAAHAQTPEPTAYSHGERQRDAPGVVHRVTLDALSPPDTAASHIHVARVQKRPKDAALHVPAGFEVTLLAAGLAQPRTLRVAPNGDVFVAESGGDRISVLHFADGPARPPTTTVFATGLSQPFGIAFWPPGDAGPAGPRFVYVGATDRVVRFPYRIGDQTARGPAETVVPQLPQGGHWTRDLVFSADGRRLFVSVGSRDNIAPELHGRAAATDAAWDAAHGLGAAWGAETGRAAVLAFPAEGAPRDGTDAATHAAAGRAFATGLRNCVAMALQPRSGALWCVVNERDGLGDDTPPDYATEVREGAFYGWPWFYLGAHPDPRFDHPRPDLAGRVSLPDVLIQAHSAPLGIAFYDGTMFPPAYRGDAFVAMHGSWNRVPPTGYKVVRLRFADGRPTGEYEDFLTGFLLPDGTVWGRPVSVAVAQDGALLVSEDGNGTIWRIAYRP